MMNIAPDRRVAAIALGVLACLLTGAGGNAAHAQVKLKAHYTISMTGVLIGQIVWLVALGEQRYTASANGKASGVLSVLVNGEGAVDARGTVIDGHLTPRYFTSKISDDEGNSELRMTFEEGAVKDLVEEGAPPRPGRLAVSEADRRGVTDPLSAMLIHTGDDVLASENCNHVLRVFDGRRRYDLALSFKRVDKIAIEHSYAGDVLVCSVVLKPIAGYRADSLLVKYVGGHRDMELWFAPVAGTSIVAPIRVLMPTLIGTLEIKADLFDALAPPLPEPVSVPAMPSQSPL